MGNRDMIQLLLDNGALPNTVNGVSGILTSNATTALANACPPYFYACPYNYIGELDSTDGCIKQWSQPGCRYTATAWS